MSTETLPTPTAPAPVTPPPLPNVPAPEPKPATFAGFNVMVEHPKGSTRMGVDDTGKPWSSLMHNSYGYIPKGKGGDGEAVDCYLGHNEDAKNVHIVHQNDSKGNYDEDKAVIGVDSVDEAKAIHQAHVPPDRYRSTTVMPKERFAEMLTKAEPGSVHWKKKNSRAHETTAMLSNATDGELVKLLDLLSKSPYAADGLAQMIEMAKAKLARCPGCKSHDITRMPAKSADEGPMDKCKICNKIFSHKPGSITAEQHSMNMARQNGKGDSPVDPGGIGTTNTAGWQEGEDPPVMRNDGTTVGDPSDSDDDEDDKANSGQDDADQVIANLKPSLRSNMARRVLGKA